MAIGNDRVQVFKSESIANGGSEDNPTPTVIDPQTDAIECAGVLVQDALVRDESVGIMRDAGQLYFFDQVMMMPISLTQLANPVIPLPPASLTKKVGIKGDGTAKNVYYTHNLQNELGAGHGVDISVEVWNRLTNKKLTPGKSGDNLTNIQIIDGNIVLAQFTTAPAVNSIKFIVID